MLHREPGDDGFAHRRNLARLHYVAKSRAAATGLAENYVGLPLPG
jgi:p-hydroxybenzoate 3-monooxygenase